MIDAVGIQQDVSGLNIKGVALAQLTGDQGEVHPLKQR